MAAAAYILLTISASPALADDCAAPLAGGTLTLRVAVERFEQCNPQRREARDAVTAAEADRISASHVPNPILGLSVSNINPAFGVGNGSLTNRTVDSAVRLDQLIERGGKRSARTAAASATLEVAEAGEQDTRLRGLQALLEAYLNLSAAAATAEQLRASATSYGQSLQLMQRRLQSGDVAAIEVQRTELDVARAEADADAADLAVGSSRGTLAMALGIPQVSESVRTIDVDTLSNQWQMQGRNSEANTDRFRRPDVRAAAARVDSTRSLVSLAEASRKRDVDLTLGFDHWPASFANPQGTGNSFIIGASIPLFLYDSGRGGLMHARADLDSAASELRGRESAAEVEVDSLQQALRQVRSLATRYREQLVPAALQVLRAQEAAYTRGGSNLLDLLDARRNARQVTVNSIATQRDALITAGRLEVALGRDPMNLLPGDEAVQGSR